MAVGPGLQRRTLAFGWPHSVVVSCPRDRRCPCRTQAVRSQCAHKAIPTSRNSQTPLSHLLFVCESAKLGAATHPCPPSSTRPTPARLLGFLGPLGPSLAFLSLPFAFFLRCLIPLLLSATNYTAASYAWQSHCLCCACPPAGPHPPLPSPISPDSQASVSCAPACCFLRPWPGQPRPASGPSPVHWAGWADRRGPPGAIAFDPSSSVPIGVCCLLVPSASSYSFIFPRAGLDATGCSRLAEN